MKGAIVRCLEDLVVSKWGKDAWTKSRADAGISQHAIILPTSDIDDAVVMKAVQAVCANHNLTLEQAADAFGDYWVNVYSQTLYSQIYKNHTSAKAFLSDMDNLHVKMTRTMANARPPRFTFEWKNEKTLIMHYNSHRGLLDFLVGLAKGVGTYYKEKLTVTKVGASSIQVCW